MALAAVDSGLRSLEQSYAERLFRWQQMAIERIEETVKTSSASLILATGLGLNTVELSNDLLNIRTRIANFGRGQVTAELGRT